MHECYFYHLSAINVDNYSVQVLYYTSYRCIAANLGMMRLQIMSSDLQDKLIIVTNPDLKKKEAWDY